MGFLQRIILPAAAICGAASLLLASPASAELNKCQKELSKNHAKIVRDVQKETQKCADTAQKDIDKGKRLLKAAQKCEKGLGKLGLGPGRDPTRSKIQKTQLKIADVLPGGTKQRCEDGDLVALGLFPAATHGVLTADLLAMNGVRHGLNAQLSSNAATTNLFQDLSSDFCSRSGRVCDFTAFPADEPCESITRYCLKSPEVACTDDTECAALVPNDKCDTLDPQDVCAEAAAIGCPTCTLFARRDRDAAGSSSEGFPVGACRDVSCSVGGATSITLNLPIGTLPVDLGGNFVLSACDFTDLNDKITALYGSNSRTLRASIPGTATVCTDIASATGYIDNSGTIPEFGYANCLDADLTVDDCAAAGFPEAVCQVGPDNQAAPTGPIKQCLTPILPPAAPAIGSSNIVVSVILNTVTDLPDETGTDGVPCSPDDESAPGSVQSLTLTTGNASSVYFDAGGGAADIGPVLSSGTLAPASVSGSGDTLSIAWAAAFASNSDAPIIGENVAELVIECTP